MTHVLIRITIDVVRVHWETDTADGLRQSGYSKERRLEPQLTVGLLTTVDGFPLVIREFEGNRADTRTLLPVVDQFQQMCPNAQITIVADAGMLSYTNLSAMEQAGYQFIIGRVATRRTGRVPALPVAVTEWLDEHPGQSFHDGQILGGPTRVGYQLGLGTGLSGFSSVKPEQIVICVELNSQLEKPKPLLMGELPQSVTDSLSVIEIAGCD